MAKIFEKLTDKHIEFIHRQQMFFVGTAGPEGFINVSPKGFDSLRVINQSRLLWLNLTGSGNETAAHVLENRRMTIMFCSFDKQSLILRVYGQARTMHRRDPDWEECNQLFEDYLGARQIFDLDIEMVQTSCGFGVPYYELAGERPVLKQWADNKGEQGIRDYWQEKNSLSLNGKPTGIIDPAN